MIGRIILIVFACLSVLGLTDIFSQTSLSFYAKYEGVNYPLDSIEIRNIHNETKMVKYYPDTILNLVATSIEKRQILSGNKFELNQNYPNPFYNQTNFDLSLSHNESVFITISNIYGQQILNSEIKLPEGINHFVITGGAEKLLFLNVKSNNYSAGIKMSNACAGTGSDVELEYIGASQNIQNVQNVDEKYLLKSGNVEFAYSSGDSLRFTGYITKGGLVLSNTIGERPTVSKEYAFNFIKEKRIAILMYHNLVEGASEDIYDRNTTDFENDLIYIRDNYQLLSMNDLLLLQSGELELERDGVIVTFDDGYKSTYDLAFPLLKSYNIPATIYVVAEWMDTSPYLDWSEVWLMSEYVNLENKRLIEIGSHTSSHPFLEKMEESFSTHNDYLDFLDRQLGESKEWIVDITDQPDIFLALPYGDGANNNDIIDSATRGGYKGIRTSMWNSFTVDEMDLFALPSLPILFNSQIEIIENYLDL